MLIFALIAIVVVLGLAAWMFVNSSKSQEKIIPLPVNEQTNNNPVEPTVEQAMKQAGIVTEAAEPLEQPRVNTQVVTEGQDAVDLNATEPIALVSGKVCPYGKEFPAGKVIFYDNEQNRQIIGDLPADQGTYTFTVPVGKYTSFFVPTDTSLPVFAYTDYVACGMTPNDCTNHALLVGEYEAEGQYGQVNVCDPQYDQAGLPESLTYENK
jgi:hypothetical protein